MVVESTTTNAEHSQEVQDLPTQQKTIQEIWSPASKESRSRTMGQTMRQSHRTVCNQKKRKSDTHPLVRHND